MLKEILQTIDILKNKMHTLQVPQAIRISASCILHFHGALV